MKKVISLVLVLLMLLALSVPVYATKIETAQAISVSHYQYSEYDYYAMLKQGSIEKLNTLGITKQEAASFVSEFENALASRASLSNLELQNLGYAEDEIELLHAYANGASLSDAELQGIAGVCTGTITNYGCDGDSASFQYSWEWDHAPFITLNDSAAMRWLAYDAYGHEINVIKTTQYTKVKYYSGTVFHHYGWRTEEEPNLDFNTINLQFPVIETVYTTNALSFDTYAKIGQIAVVVEVDSSVNNAISYVLVAGLYGHTTVGIGSPSVSVGYPPSIAISFTGNTSIDTIAGRQAQLPHGTNVIYI